MFATTILKSRSPKTVDETEKANAPQPNELPAFLCPVCDARMVLRDVRPMAGFKLRDVRRHEMRCDDCGMMADRIYHPAIGYDQTIAL